MIVGVTMALPVTPPPPPPLPPLSLGCSQIIDTTMQQLCAQLDQSRAAQQLKASLTDAVANHTTTLPPPVLPIRQDTNVLGVPSASDSLTQSVVSALGRLTSSGSSGSSQPATGTSSTGSSLQTMADVFNTMMRSQGVDTNQLGDTGLVNQLQNVKLDDGFKNVIQQSGGLGTVLSDADDPAGLEQAAATPSPVAQWGQKLIDVYNANAAQSALSTKPTVTTTPAPAVVAVASGGDQQSLGTIPQPTMVGMVVNELKNQGLSAVMQNAANQLSKLFLGK